MTRFAKGSAWGAAEAMDPARWDTAERRAGRERRAGMERRNLLNAWDFPLAENRRDAGDRRCGYDRRR
jgi:hypothetical protein